jgi:5-methylcytosine-specific restriction endonuclease McrA
MQVIKFKPVKLKAVVTAGMKTLGKSKIDLFKELGNYNAETGQTRMVCVSEFKGPYADLVLGNGGSWCRRSAFENDYKAYTVKRNGTISYLWSATTEEEEAVQKERDDYYTANNIKATKGVDIYLLKIFGKAATETQRPIRADIRATVCAKSCVVCGTNATICDHKNDLYNDPRVLSTATQTLDDFQPLCNHCNLQKRQVAKKTRSSGKRYGATNIAQLTLFGIDFLEGGETFDPADPKAMVGTYWYDPVAFLAEVKRSLSSSDKTGTLE